MGMHGSRVAGASRWPGERIAAAAFGVYLVAAIPILVKLGSHYWFRGDEWAFFVTGSIADPAGLFQPIQSHWSTIPIILYRALYGAFGLHSYLPYQLSVILLHLILCWLLRAIMRRAGVGPWMATVSAATFVLFGSSETNILDGVQVSQVGSVVFGFAHLLLADHEGGIDRRDWLGLVCGLLGIMSSGLGPPMVAIVGMAAMCRRGWLPALIHTVPLAAIYLIWLFINRAEPLGDQSLPPLIIFAHWVLHAMTGAFLALAGHAVVAVALGVLLVTGLALAWVPLSLAEFRQRASLPTAMLVGALVLQGVICTQRWPIIWYLGIDAARLDRYLGVCVALSLPAIAVAADAVVQRWRWMMPVVCALFLVGVVFNFAQFGSDSFRSPNSYVGPRATVLAVAYSPLAEHVPADMKPYPSGTSGGDMDMAFLLDARNSGRLPPPPVMTTALQAQTELRLSVQEIPGPIPASLSCEEYVRPIEIQPEVGDLYGFKKPILISLGEAGAPLAYNAGWGFLQVIRVLRPDLTLRLAPVPPADRFVLCFRADGAKTRP